MCYLLFAMYVILDLVADATRPLLSLKYSSTTAFIHAACRFGIRETHISLTYTNNYNKFNLWIFFIP